MCRICHQCSPWRGAIAATSCRWDRPCTTHCVFQIGDQAFRDPKPGNPKVRITEKGGLSLRGVLAVLESTLPSFCLSYKNCNKIQHNEATVVHISLVMRAAPHLILELIAIKGCMLLWGGGKRTYSKHYCGCDLQVCRDFDCGRVISKPFS